MKPPTPSEERIHNPALSARLGRAPKTREERIEAILETLRTCRM